MTTNHNICLRCKGSGISRAKECYDCKGTGLAVRLVPPAEAVFAGTHHLVGDIIPFTTTASKPADGRIIKFEVDPEFMRVKEGYPANVYPLRVVWMELENIATGTTSGRPLWRSITLKKKNELFETNITKRI